MKKHNTKTRKKQDDPWVMYLIVRESLGMSTGKIAAQVGHAVGILYRRHAKLARKVDDYWISCPIYMEERPLSEWSDEEKEDLTTCQQFDDWQDDSFRKIVLKAKDSKWKEIKENLDCYIVYDAGLTEIEPGSETVIGLWPMRKSQRPNIIRELHTL